MGGQRVESFGLDFAFYRGLDPILGKWMQIDPYSESFYSRLPKSATSIPYIKIPAKV